MTRCFFHTGLVEPEDDWLQEIPDPLSPCVSVSKSPAYSYRRKDSLIRGGALSRVICGRTIAEAITGGTTVCGNSNLTRVRTMVVGGATMSRVNGLPSLSQVQESGLIFGDGRGVSRSENGP